MDITKLGVGVAICVVMFMHVARAEEWNGGQGWSKLDVPARRAMWVWGAVPVQGDKEANRHWDGERNTEERFYSNYKGSMDLFLDFCENKSIRVVYMFSGTYEWSRFKGSQLENSHMVTPFLSEANKRGIQVWYMYYLFDDPNDARLNKDDSMILEIAKAVEKHNKNNPKARYAGIHCDQEPGESVVYPALLKNTKMAYDWIKSSRSRLLMSHALRPSWRNQKLKWDGQEKTMNEHMQDNLHHGALMAYSDRLKTVHEWSDQALAYASKTGRKLAVGTEVNDLKGKWKNSDKETWFEEILSEPAKTRFKKEAKAPLTWEYHLQAVVDRQKLKTSFDRIVIHAYRGYFKHWFGMEVRDYIQSQGDRGYVSSKINPEKVNLKEDTRPLLEK